MKIAIYTIALNEEANAAEFMRNCVGADLVVVGDTGSTDRTAQIIREQGGKIVPLRTNPWRFDIPRNTVLSLLPPDIDLCISLDLDERLPMGWRKILDENWTATYSRLHFRYVHSFKQDGTYGTTSLKYNGHTRFNYVWRHAIHEALYYVGPDKEQVLKLPQFVVEHRQRPKASRDNYLPLLELECNSSTATPRHIFWLAREYINHERWDEAIKTGERFLACPDGWSIEQAAMMRYIAKALANTAHPERALTWHLLAVDKVPNERDGWLDLAWYYHTRQEWAQAFAAVTQCLAITQRAEHYLSGDDAWSHKVDRLAALCCTKLGMIKQAREHLAIAIQLAPNEESLYTIAETIGLKVNRAV